MISICLILVACEPTKKTADLANTEQVTLVESAEVEQVSPIESAEVEQVSPIESAEVEEVAPIETVEVEQVSPIETAEVEEVVPIEIAEVVAVKDVLVWQNVSEISNSNFHKVAAQKLYQKYGVDCTNTLLVVPSPDGTAGIINIPLNQKYNSFFTRVCVAVDNPWPYETITIYCDGQERELIKKIGPKNAPRNLEIDTKNVDMLTIKVKPGRKGYYEKVVFFDTTLN